MLDNDLTQQSDTPRQPDGAVLPAAFLMADQRQRWQRGERVFLESYFRQHPEWCDSTERLLDLVYHEILVRERNGEEPILEEYVERFPHLAKELRMHFEVHAVLGAVTLPLEESQLSAPPIELPGFEILERLGVGGMGVVYKARQIALDRIVALKMTAQLAGGPLDAHERLLAEARAVASLHHPHIVQIHDVGEEGGVPYFSMEYVDGGNLAQYLRVAHWPAQIAAAVLECLARTIHAAHNRGIIHRDLKPANILLKRVDPAGGLVEHAYRLPGSEEVIPKITDFGLAKLLDEDKERTRSGMVVGTPNYMAPEQVRRDAGLIGPATDVHALGAILYEMLTSVTPFRAVGVLETLDQVLHEDPLPPRQLQGDIPLDLETICLKCLRKEPDRRYRSALDLAEDLRRFQAGEPVLARPMGQAERTWRWCRRRPALATLMATVVAFVGTVTVGAVATSISLRHRTDAALQAEGTALQLLGQSYFDQARLGRLDLSLGQRSRSLELLSKAAHLKPDLDVRNEAITCLARADWQPVREWVGNPLLCGVAFDAEVERYAHCENGKVVIVRSALDDRELKRLEAMPDGLPPQLLAFSPNGRYLAGSCSANRQARLLIWELETGREILRLPTLEHGAAFAFAPDSAAVATAIEPKRVAIYEIPSGRERLRLERVAPVNVLAFNAPGTKLALSSDGVPVAEVYDLESRQRTHRLEHPALVRGVDWSADGQWLATGCDDALVYVWDLAHSRLQATLPGHRAAIIRTAFRDSDEGMVTGSWDGTCRWWDLETRQTVLTAPGSLVFLAKSGRRMALGNFDRLSFWEKAAPEIRHELRPGTGASNTPTVGRLGIRYVDAAPGGFLAAATVDGVHIWNTHTLREVDFLPLNECMVARFDPTGHFLAAYGKEGLFRWSYQLANGAFQAGERERLPLPINFNFGSRDLCWGPGGAYILITDYRSGKVFRVDLKGSVALQDLARRGGVNRIVQSLQGAPVLRDFGRHRFVTSIAQSPDGRWVVTGTWQGPGLRIWVTTGTSQDQGLRVWDTTRPMPVADIEGSRPGATSMRAAFSPDGATLAASGQQEYRFLETGTWRLLFTLPRDHIDPSPGPVAYSPDGRFLAVMRTPGQVQLLDPATYQQLATLTSPYPISITNLCFDAESTHLAVATPKHGVHWWDLEALRAELERMGLNWDDKSKNADHKP